MKSAPVMAATCAGVTFMFGPCVVCGPGPPFNFLANVIFFQSQKGKIWNPPAEHCSYMLNTFA